MLVSVIIIILLLTLFAPVAVQGFTITTTTTTTTTIHRRDNAPSSYYWALSSSSSTSTWEAVLPERVQVLPNADAVSAKICIIVETAAEIAIQEKGIFYLAIPGGSILKMLSGCTGAWTGRTVVAYVNHKCVDSQKDLEQSTHAKAMKLFMNQWEGCTPILPDGTANGEMEAIAYAEKLVQAKIPMTAKGIPIFDLALIGVGDDGHIGSLYPHRKEVFETTKTVLAVNKKSPPSITLSLPVMQNAKQVVVAACGVSEKYPLGKSDAMRRAVVSELETLESFPAIGLRNVATWIMDEPAACMLGDVYQTAKTEVV